MAQTDKMARKYTAIIRLSLRIRFVSEIFYEPSFSLKLKPPTFSHIWSSNCGFNCHQYTEKTPFRKDDNKRGERVSKKRRKSSKILTSKRTLYSPTFERAREGVLVFNLVCALSERSFI